MTKSKLLKQFFDEMNEHANANAKKISNDKILELQKHGHTEKANLKIWLDTSKTDIDYWRKWKKLDDKYMDLEKAKLTYKKINNDIEEIPNIKEV